METEVVVAGVALVGLLAIVLLARRGRRTGPAATRRPRQKASPIRRPEYDPVTGRIKATILLIGDHGNWLDLHGGRQAYDELLRTPLHQYHAAMRRCLVGSDWSSHRAFVLAVKLGREGTEECMTKALWESNGVARRLCTDMLNSGNPRLSGTAETWAVQYGYAVTTTGALPGARWGVF